jgi:protein O-mannosyl-transferase
MNSKLICGKIIIMLNNINLKKHALITYIFLAMVTLAVFWQVNQFNFVNIDDDIYVTENSHIRSGITLDGIHWAFSTLHAEFWHPLTWLSLMLDYQLYGLNAGGYHVTNVILHILSTILLFWLFNRMTGAFWKSAFVAAFFALHPLRVESVAWVAERKDVLSGFFWMLTLCLYVYYTEKPAIKRYALVLFCFVCGLMSKPMVVTMPVVMILLDYWPLGRFESHKGKLLLWQLKEKALFFVLSAVFSIITIYAQHKLSVNDFSISSRLANAPVSFITYLEKTFWPHDMAVFYPFSDQLLVWQILGSTLLIIAISVAVIIMVKRFPYLFVGWLWYAITLLPVIGIIRSTIHSMHDNYTYLPSIGIAIMLAWGIPLLFPREDTRKNILFPAGIAVIAVLAVLTWQQCSYWKNSVTVFSHALLVTKDNYIAHNNLGIVLFSEGKTNKALHHYNKAIRIINDNAIVYTNRGILFTKIGQYNHAIEDFNEAIRLKSDYADAYNGRGNACYKLGQYQQTLTNYNEAIRLKPDYADAYNNRGVAYYKLGQYQQALADYNEAIRLKLDYAEACYNRGNAYYETGQYQHAVADYNKAINLKQNYVRAYNNRGNAYLSLGNKNLGCHDLKEACTMGVCNGLEWAKETGLCR